MAPEFETISILHIDVGDRTRQFEIGKETLTVVVSTAFIKLEQLVEHICFERVKAAAQSRDEVPGPLQIGCMLERIPLHVDLGIGMHLAQDCEYIGFFT